jgi:alkaline phosphatase
LLFCCFFSGWIIQGLKIYILIGIAEKSKTDGLNYTTLTYATGTEIKYFAVNATHISRTDPSRENLRDFLYQQQSTISTDEALHGGSDVAVYAKG